MSDPWVLIGVLVSVVAGFAAFRAWRISAASDRRALEVNDTVWFFRPAAEGWIFEHVGSVAAQQVQIVLTVDRVTEVSEFEHVRAGEQVLAKNRWHVALLEQAASEARENEVENEERSRPIEISNGFGGLPMQIPSMGLEIPYFGIKNIEIRAVITWRSPLGAPRSQTLSSSENYYGDEEYE